MKIKLECQECGRKFSSGSADPRCPKCGSVDFYVSEDLGSLTSLEKAQRRAKHREFKIKQFHQLIAAAGSK